LFLRPSYRLVLHAAAAVITTAYDHAPVTVHRTRGIALTPTPASSRLPNLASVAGARFPRRFAAPDGHHFACNSVQPAPRAFTKAGFSLKKILRVGLPFVLTTG
jgi:hypothetical protein